MSGGSTVARSEWLRRVLGVSLPRSGGSETPAARWAAARSAWQAASDTADAQIAALQTALRASGDDVLEEIAEFGLNGVTGGFKVPLMAAMREVDAGGVTPTAAAKLAKVVDGFSAHVANDERIMACDENPFGVTVNLRATLGAALAKMRQAISTVKV